MTTSAHAFIVQDLVKHYSLADHIIPVLQGINLSIARGEWVALTGASGSGKTTLLHLLAALDKPTQGTIQCLDQPYHLAGPRRRAMMRRNTIGLLFQNYHLFPELNAVENATLPALHWGRDRDQAILRGQELLTEFGLADRFEHRPRELSGGEQQRVALARALINDPEIILADEPTGNLDAQAGEHIISIIAELNKQQGKTVVMVTHDRDLANRADRILQLAAGRVVPAA